METLLLLHGAVGSAAQLQPLAGQLGESFKVYSLDFSGHGGSPFSDTAFSIELFAGDVLQFMREKEIGKTHIFGYSMGGYVGMYLARYHPDKINKVITLATKFYWDEATATHETKMLDPEKMEQKVPAFAAALRYRHQHNDWKEVLKKTAGMMQGLAANNALKTGDYPLIQAPSLLLIGDRDKMVTLEETAAVYKSLLHGAMGVLPNTPHPIEQVDIDILGYTIRRFLIR